MRKPRRYRSKKVEYDPAKGASNQFKVGGRRWDVVAQTRRTPVWSDEGHKRDGRTLLYSVELAGAPAFFLVETRGELVTG